MSQLTIVRTGGSHTNLGRRIAKLDARILLNRVGLGSHVDELEVEAGNTKVFWTTEPNTAQLKQLAELVDEQ